MFLVEHYIVDEPEQVVETYGPFMYRQSAEQFSYGLKMADYGPQFQWDARVIPLQ